MLHQTVARLSPYPACDGTRARARTGGWNCFRRRRPYGCGVLRELSLQTLVSRTIVLNYPDTGRPQYAVNIAPPANGDGTDWQVGAAGLKLMLSPLRPATRSAFEAAFRRSARSSSCCPLRNCWRRAEPGAPMPSSLPSTAVRRHNFSRLSLLRN